MNKIEIIATEEFKNNYEGYGYEEFTRKALNKCCNKKELGLVGKITLIDAEPSKRVFFTNEQGIEFTIRYFVHDEINRTWKASYTLYKQVPDEDGSHGEEISCGHATIHYILTAEDEERIVIEKNTIKQAPIVTSAKVSVQSGYSNISWVDFTLNLTGDHVFGIKFFNNNPTDGAIFPDANLYLYTEIPYEAKGVTEQIMKILKETNQSLCETKEIK
jgi:hypothetical protein